MSLKCFLCYVIMPSIFVRKRSKRTISSGQQLRSSSSYHGGAVKRGVRRSCGSLISCPGDRSRLERDELYVQSVPPRTINPLSRYHLCLLDTIFAPQRNHRCVTKDCFFNSGRAALLDLDAASTRSRRTPDCQTIILAKLFIGVLAFHHGSSAPSA